MYGLALTLHSWIRWFVLLMGLVAVLRALAGWFGRRRWEAADDQAGLLFTISMDVQMLVGLLLYFVLSPFTTVALRSMGTAMREPALRFWAVEHVTLMLIALVLAHVGRVRVRGVSDPRTKHFRAMLFFGLALIAVLMAIPWPGMANGRPLLRFGLE